MVYCCIATKHIPSMKNYLVFPVFCPLWSKHIGYMIVKVVKLCSSALRSKNVFEQLIASQKALFITDYTYMCIPKNVQAEHVCPFCLFY